MLSPRLALLASLTLCVSCALVLDVEGDYREVAGSEPAAEPEAGVAGGGGAGDIAGAGGGGAAPDAGSGCDAPAVCQLLNGMIANSGPSHSRTRQGVGSALFVLELLESDGDSKDPSYTASLVSPKGADYDLYVTSSLDPMVCPPAASGSKAGEPGESFGEVLATQGNSSAWIIAEVRYVSGPCGPTDEWTLTILGNTGGS